MTYSMDYYWELYSQFWTPKMIEIKLIIVITATRNYFDSISYSNRANFALASPTSGSFCFRFRRCRTSSGGTRRKSDRKSVTRLECVASSAWCSKGPFIVSIRHIRHRLIYKWLMATMAERSLCGDLMETCYFSIVSFSSVCVWDPMWNPFFLHYE